MLQRSNEWYEARLGRATASKFSAVMANIATGEAALRKNYRADLVVERLTGIPTPTFTTVDMQWGIDTEPLARLRYTLASKNKVKECGFYAHETLMAGASPDGLIGDRGILEIKCPKTANHIEALKTQDLPKMYFWQVMGQLWITDKKWAEFVSFDPRLPDNASLFIKRIERDEEAIKRLETTVTAFLKTVDDEVEFVTTYGKEKPGNKN